MKPCSVYLNRNHIVGTEYPGFTEMYCFVRVNKANRFPSGWPIAWAGTTWPLKLPGFINPFRLLKETMP
jgi:hypothetical protein